MKATSFPHIPLQFERFAPEEMEQRAEAFYQQCNQRRSVREYSDEPVSVELLKKIIHTAGTAPSGAHKQPWFFCLITDPEIKRQIRIAAEKEEKENYQKRFPKAWLDDLEIFGTDENKENLEEAPALIVVFRETYQIIDGERVKNYYVQESAGIAAGMLINAIHNAGLVSLTHTPNPMAFLNTILDRPKNEVPFLLMPVGYPKEGAKVPDFDRKPLDEIMKHY